LYGVAGFVFFFTGEQISSASGGEMKMFPWGNFSYL